MTDQTWTIPGLNIDPNNYSVAEFLEWDEAGKLDLSPDFQRGEVWRNPAKAYLIDTILRNFPIPPIHVRILQHPERGLVREVVDGQQRLTAVLQFVRGKFALGRPKISSESRPPWAGKKFKDLDESQKNQIKTYAFRCEVYKGAIADEVIHEVFSRINIHSVPLSDQELRNGKWFGEFKQSVYELAIEHNAFWKAAGIFTTAGTTRMLDAQFVSEALVLQLAGMQDKKGSIDTFYAQYDVAWADREEHEERFRQTIDEIRQSVGDVLPETRFRRPPFFYTLYAVVYHRIYGIDNQRLPERAQPLPDTPRMPISEGKAGQLGSTLESLTSALEIADASGPLAEFLRASSRQTDNIRPRLTRFHTLWQMADLSER